MSFNNNARTWTFLVDWIEIHNEIELLWREKERVDFKSFENDSSNQNFKTILKNRTLWGAIKSAG